MSMYEFVKAKVANIRMPHLVFCYLCSAPSLLKSVDLWDSLTQHNLWHVGTLNQCSRTLADSYETHDGLYLVLHYARFQL